MKTLGRTWSIVIAAVVAVVVLAGGWFGLVKPQKDKVDKIKADAATQQQSNDTLRLQLSMLQSLARQLPKQQAELAALKEKVPDQVELSNLLRQLVQSAKDSGVTLTTFSPAAPAALQGAPGIQYVDITMAFNGGYADVVTFDSTLESLSRTLMVKAFTLSRNEGTGNATGGSSGGSSTTTAAAGTVTANFQGRVLVRSGSASTSPSSSTTGSSGTTSGSTGTTTGRSTSTTAS